MKKLFKNKGLVAALAMCAGLASLAVTPASQAYWYHYGFGPGPVVINGGWGCARHVSYHRWCQNGRCHYTRWVTRRC